MLEERQQSYRREFFFDCLCDKTREDACLCVHQRIAAGIVEIKFPAPEDCHDTPRQRAVRRHQSGGNTIVPCLTHRNRNGKRLHFGIRSFDYGEPVHSSRNLRCDLRLKESRVPDRT